MSVSRHGGKPQSTKDALETLMSGWKIHHNDPQAEVSAWIAEAVWTKLKPERPAEKVTTHARESLKEKIEHYAAALVQEHPWPRKKEEFMSKLNVLLVVDSIAKDILVMGLHEQLQDLSRKK